MKELTIFGLVILDVIKYIEDFPKTKGSYTEVKNALTLLGGNAGNTICCISSWLNELRKEQGTLESEVLIHLNTIQLADDNDGRALIPTIDQYLTRYASSDYSRFIDVRIPPLVDRSLMVTPSVDIYVSDDTERTMLGLGFTSCDRYMGQHKQIYLESIEWKEDAWITLDYNTASVSNHIIERAGQCLMNMYVMDHVLPARLPLQPSSDDKSTPRSSFIYQTSTDWRGKRDDIHATLGAARLFLEQFPDTFVIITDGANGLACGGWFKRSVREPAEYFEPFWHYAPKLDIKSVDSIGAGDAFRAGFLFSLLMGGRTLVQCLDFASVSGGLNTRHVGGCSHVPTRLDILQVLGQLHQHHQQ
ncbi:hypothetical protein SAMD00019534_055390 [Acytostelium subglobosum LB1]|uniref:hypothetical protein n=1 Tax=Acytostelium subglobosum LB1 TaxID=1410327 RepID=UPI000644C019|nr:hypothetical protein SAMD00019534_055390 [Acytostelium subglobosum LB1]GAM22364.1 hypothetical protein SAMD00019534_055390 [Acytostelium subglobosum LB1]|eukprot:XP_012754484.1 hypothetical protein SAMD00019534_055390 [Acytostelium subglobosum LB1]